MMLSADNNPDRWVLIICDTGWWAGRCDIVRCEVWKSHLKEVPETPFRVLTAARHKSDLVPLRKLWLAGWWSEL